MDELDVMHKLAAIFRIRSQRSESLEPRNRFWGLEMLSTAASKVTENRFGMVTDWQGHPSARRIVMLNITVESSIGPIYKPFRPKSWSLLAMNCATLVYSFPMVWSSWGLPWRAIETWPRTTGLDLTVRTKTCMKCPVELKFIWVDPGFAKARESGYYLVLQIEAFGQLHDYGAR